jgi:sortase A
MSGERRPFVEWLSRLLIATGLLCLGWVGLVSAEATLFRRAQLQAMVSMTAETANTAAAPVTLPVGSPLGVLAIPRLGFAEAVAEGEDESTLSIAIGHVPDTPMPWHQGNSGFAGHRTTHFRPLNDVRIGDELLLTTPHGLFRYVVRQTLIVDPSDVWVLDPTPGRQLTLITCYPFTYIGRAPKRFIVKADQNGGFRTP